MWHDLHACMRSIQHGLQPTRLQLLAPHKPIIARMATYLDAVDVLAIRAAYEGYTRLFAHGRWHANMPVQWFYGAHMPEHDAIVKLLRAHQRYDLLELLIAVMPAKRLFDTGDFDIACEQNKHVDVCARVLVKHKLQRPYMEYTCMYNPCISLRYLTEEMCKLASVRVLIAHMHPRNIASAIGRLVTNSGSETIIEFLKTVYVESYTATDYVDKHRYDIKRYSSLADELEASMLSVLLSDFNYAGPAKQHVFYTEPGPGISINPLFADVPDELKIPLVDRIYA